MMRREDFLKIKTYEEFNRRRDELDGLKITGDREMLDHLQFIFEEAGVKFGTQDPNDTAIYDYFGKSNKR